MAIGTDLLKDRMVLMLQVAEEKIDARLKAAINKVANFNGTLYIDGQDINRDVVLALKPRYLAAGWADFYKTESSYTTSTDITVKYFIKFDELTNRTVKEAAENVILDTRQRKITVD